MRRCSRIYGLAKIACELRRAARIEHGNIGAPRQGRVTCKRQVAAPKTCRFVSSERGLAIVRARRGVGAIDGPQNHRRWRSLTWSRHADGNLVPEHCQMPNRLRYRPPRLIGSDRYKCCSRESISVPPPVLSAGPLPLIVASMIRHGAMFATALPLTVIECVALRRCPENNAPTFEIAADPRRAGVVLHCSRSRHAGRRALSDIARQCQRACPARSHLGRNAAAGEHGSGCRSCPNWCPRSSFPLLLTVTEFRPGLVIIHVGNLVAHHKLHGRLRSGRRADIPIVANHQVARKRRQRRPTC